jgi:hypothetical protein
MGAMRRTLDLWLRGAAVFAAGFALAVQAVSWLVAAAESDGIPGPSGHVYGYTTDEGQAWLGALMLAPGALGLTGALLLAAALMRLSGRRRVRRPAATRISVRYARSPTPATPGTPLRGRAAVAS